MKKIATILMLALTVAGLNSVKAQARIHAGIAQQNLYTTSSTTILGITASTQDTTSIIGYYAGLSYTVDLNHHFEFTLGVNANYFNKRDTISILDMAGVSADFTEVNLTIPLHLGYSIHFGEKIRLGVYAGPTVNFGLVNHTQYQGSLLGISKGWTTDWFENDDANTDGYYRERFGWALTAGARLSLGSLSLEAGYTYGMSDNYRSENLVGRCDHLSLGLSFAF